MAGVPPRRPAVRITLSESGAIVAPILLVMGGEVRAHQEPP
jgi:hypothetical protein